MLKKLADQLSFKNLPGSNRTARNVSLLYTALVINMVLGYLVVKLNSSYLTVSQFGQYSFFVNVILFTRVFMSFGLFESGSRLLAIEKNSEQIRRLWGAVFVITAVLSIITIALTYSYSLFFDRLFEIKISSLLQVFALLSFAVLLQSLFPPLLRGQAKIKLLSAFTIAPRLIYALALTALILTGFFALDTSLLMYLASLFVVCSVFIYLVRPIFKNFRSSAKKLIKEIKGYGSHIYITNIMSAIFLHVDKVLLAFFVNDEQLGYYALAYALTFPLSHFPNALGTSAFRSYARRKRIGTKHFAVNTAVVLLAGAALILLREFIITVLFSERFAEAQTVFVLLVIAFGLGALAIPLTLFFKAKGKGLHVRNITITAQLLYLLLMFVLVPLYGINGAAWAAIIAFTLDLILYLYFYKKLFPV